MQLYEDNHKFVGKTNLCTFRPIFQVRTNKNLDGQPEIVTWLSVGQHLFSLNSNAGCVALVALP